MLLLSPETILKGGSQTKIENIFLFCISNMQVCCDCKEVIKPGMIYISSNRAPSEQVWHPACFCCSECSDLLVDLIHFYDEDNQKLYCGRHYLELKVPRCFGCDEVSFIMSNHYNC